MARKRKKKKWGKVGSPKSAKRRRWLRRMRAAHKGRVLKRKVSGNSKRRKRRRRRKR